MSYFDPSLVMPSGHAVAKPPLAERLAGAVRRHALVAVWLAWSLALLWMNRSAIVGLRVQDPDDFLRLMQVRDLLAGQSWFDVTQYRMDPPHGAAMHWSRLVDLPIAAVLLTMRVFFADAVATRIAMTIVPLGQLLLVMVLVSRLLAGLGGGAVARLVAAATVPLFPLLLCCFVPMRIDHHGWQAIAALGCAACFVRSPDRRAPLIGGAVAALWLSISLEGLPLVVLFAALYGLRFMLFGERDLARFLTALAATSVVAHLATRPSSELLPHCDSIGWPHLAAFAVAASLAQVIANGGRRGGWAGPVTRGALLAVIGGLAGALILVPIGVCAVNPFATLDPVMERYWHGVIPEGLPVTRQSLSVALMMAWTPFVVLAALAGGLPDAGRPLAERRWLWMTLLALGATPVGLLVMRESVNVEALTIPFSTLLMVRHLPRLRAALPLIPRVVATVAFPLVVTPAFPSAAAVPLDKLVVPDTRAHLPGAGSTTIKPDAECNLAPLATLPASRLFATLDLGPAILVGTPHTVVASGYHRNMAKMREVVEVFSGDPAGAERIVRANHSRYVVLCLNGGDTEVFQSRRRDSLVNRLVADHPPRWLQPVAGFKQGALRVYQVR